MVPDAVKVVHPKPDVKRGVEYWESVPATVDGVLGGFGTGTLPRVDAVGSRTFLLRTLPYLSSTPPAAYNGAPREWSEKRVRERGGKGVTRTRALDCGAGVGRVSEHSLLPLVDEVHLVEPVHKFLLEAKRRSPSWAPLREPVDSSPFCAQKVAFFHTSTLQDFPLTHPHSATDGAAPAIPPTANTNGGTPVADDERAAYDVVWCQWCLQHLSESDLLKFLREAQSCLRPPSASEDEDLARPGGVIVVKENVCSDNADGSEATWYDDEDYSVTRSCTVYGRLFQSAGLEVVHTETQRGFPEELFDVQMYARWALR
ncbi:protein N-terminal methyltransferase [Malassezia sp. CBS 17886]|nr:protein N-terminal methyltransferase [Malassezia sp. CBS 17886]